MGELAAPHQMSLPAISKHLKILTRAGLVRKAKDGRIIHCDLNTAPLGMAEEIIVEYRRFWEDRFAALDTYLAEIGDEGQPD